MANNRLWLVHRPSGEAIYLGKRMGLGWYDAPADLGAQLNAFYERCAHCEDSQDDFVLAIEDANNAPGCTDKFVYDENHKPKLG